MYNVEYVFKTIEECDLNNRPMYKELIKHLKENEHLLQNNLDKEELNYEKELSIKNEELFNLKRKNDDKRASLINKNIYEEFISNVKEEQVNKLDDNQSWNKISKDMEEGLKSLQMILSLTDKSDQLKEIKINESSLKEANDILKHFYERK